LRQALLLATALLGACAGRPPVGEPVRGEGRATRMATPEDAERAKSKPEARPAPAATPPGEGPRACVNCPTPDPDYAPGADEIPADVADTPDAEVTDEPKSRYGNPVTYEAMGQRYKVMAETPRGMREHGRASWYGKKFHGRRTANGETYDMFKMTAAHKTLPLPSYVRVTSKANGRSVVVRVNDRGPFHPGRIIDLSYAAAAKLGMLHAGSAEVEMEVLGKQHGKAAAVSDQRDEGKPRYLEVGRFLDAIEAVALRERLSKLGFTETELLQVGSPAGDGLEHVLRLGPFASFSALEAARVKLGLKEITAVPVAD